MRPNPAAILRKRHHQPAAPAAMGQEVGGPRHCPGILMVLSSCILADRQVRSKGRSYLQTSKLAVPECGGPGPPLIPRLFWPAKETNSGPISRGGVQDAPIVPA